MEHSTTSYVLQMLSRNETEAFRWELHVGGVILSGRVEWQAAEHTGAFS